MINDYIQRPADFASALRRRVPNYDSLRHRFRRVYACAPRDALLSLRMEGAKNMLLESDLPVKAWGMPVSTSSRGPSARASAARRPPGVNSPCDVQIGDRMFRRGGMWIAVHAATRANGTMHIVPRSHVALAAHERDPGSDHHIYAPAVLDDQSIAIELPAGGVLFFNFGILHCTHGNQTASDRAGLALHFINGGYTTADFFKDACTVPITDGLGMRRAISQDHGQWEKLVAAAADENPSPPPPGSAAAAREGSAPTE